jgi:hypothetical protein
MKTPRPAGAGSPKNRRGAYVPAPWYTGIKYCAESLDLALKMRAHSLKAGSEIADTSSALTTFIIYLTPIILNQ